jgi:CHAT domain-containing protein/tetratricopeptide (TPR) repeat protein
VKSSEAQRHETAIDQALAEGALEEAERQAQRYLEASGPVHPGHYPARAPWFRAAYLAAQVSLAAGRLARASERLEPCLAVAEQLPDELAARVRLLAAEALARLHRGAEARRLLERMPSSLFNPQPLLFLRALRIRLWLGELAAVEGQLRACGAVLESADDGANHALLLCEEGCARESANDLDGAERCLLRAERLSRSAGVGSIRAEVLLHLGRLDHLRGRLPSALERYDESLPLAADGPQALEVRMRRLLVLLDANQWERARALADGLLDGSSAELPEELHSLAALVRSVLHGDVPADAPDEQRAYAAAARGDGAAARWLYRRALQATPSPERQARLALALGLLALGHADRADAESWLRRAEGLARERDVPEVLWRALEGRGRVAAELDGDEEAAGRLFEAAVVVSEVQSQQLQHGSDAAAYRAQRSGVLRRLLGAACRRGDAAAVFRHQELDRGRLLLDLWRGAPARPELSDFFQSPEVNRLEQAIAACAAEWRGGADAERRRAVLRRQEELKLRLDGLFHDFLRDRSRRGSTALPPLAELNDLQTILPPAAVYLAPAVVDEELYLLAVTRKGPPRVVRASGSVAELRQALDEIRDCLSGQLLRYRAGLSVGDRERAELDARLRELGCGPLGRALAQALADSQSSPRRLLWVPEDLFHGLPLAALRLKDRYLVEDFEIACTFSGAVMVHQHRKRRQGRRTFRPALVVTESPDVLPAAGREGEGVAASFLRSQVLTGAAATHAALLRGLARARVIHLACHAHFDSEHPLAAHVALPSGEVLRALEWLDGRAEGLPLVTLSACRSAEVAPLLGREVFGLVTGLLGGGVRSVLAGLWPVADRETLPLMWHFYRHRLGADLATALAGAQRECLAAPGSSPLFWAAFALFGDPAALPGPGPFGGWLARWRQARHARRFPP